MVIPERSTFATSARSQSNKLLTLVRLDENRSLMTVSELLGRLAVLPGGRVAREMVFGGSVKKFSHFGGGGLLMTTDAMLAEKPKKEKSSAPTMPSEDMY
jgi:hypothetical protein